jgi:hypothetical protein
VTQPAGSAPAVSAVSELTGLGQLIGSIGHDGRTGWKTTEFWASITTWLLPILTLVFHRDLSSLAMPLAVIAAGGAQAAYTISRAITKKGHATAVASMAAGPAMMSAAPVSAVPVAAVPVPAVAPAEPAGLAGADGVQLARAMTAALQALTAAVERLSAAGEAGQSTARAGAAASSARGS